MDRKKILIFGATGGTGRQVVAQAVARGHEVTAFVRDPAKLAGARSDVRLAVGDVTKDGTRVADAVRGQDAVISALGVGGSLKSGGLMQRSVPMILSAMRESGVRRLIYTSAIGVGAAYGDAPLVPRLMIRLMLKDIYADKGPAEDLVRQSDLDWTIVQPARLTNGPLTERYRVGEHLRHRGMPGISRANVAHFLLSQVDDGTYIHRTVRLDQ